jgi:hypothetical protein
MKIEIRQLYAPVARPYVMPCGHAGPRPCRARAPQSTRDAALHALCGRRRQKRRGVVLWCCCSGSGTHSSFRPGMIPPWVSAQQAQGWLASVGGEHGVGGSCTGPTV